MTLVVMFNSTIILKVVIPDDARSNTTLFVTLKKYLTLSQPIPVWTFETTTKWHC